MVKELRWALLLVLVISIGAVFVGISQADVFPIPAEVLDFGNLERGFVTGVDEFGTIRFYSVQGMGVIFLHNLRAIVLNSLLGIFSFGVLGVITLVLPFSMIGYFSAIVGQIDLSPGVFLTGFVLPHGVVEIPAILLTGALIIRLGITLVTPNKEYTIGEAWIRSFADWTRVIIFLVVPLLIAASFLEVFITPRVALAMFGG
jgi:uncharacterized membrane protein SpoIIM required for sporulation